MFLTFTSPVDGILKLERTEDPAPSARILPGSQLHAGSFDGGKIIAEERHNDDYSIHYCRVLTEDKATIISRQDGKGLFTTMAFKNSFRYAIADSGTLALRESRYMAVLGSLPDESLEFTAQEEYHFIKTWYSEDLIRQLESYFPKLASYDRLASTPLAPNPIWATQAILDLLRLVLDCPYEAQLRNLYFEYKWKEYLFLVLTQAFNQAGAPEKLNTHEVSAVYEVQSMIIGDLQHHYTIGQLSRKVGLNEFKLKYGFRQVFGKGIFEFLRDKRMERARELLIDTDKPVKEIASLAGYERITNFITAFRRHFGHTPGSLRRHD